MHVLSIAASTAERYIDDALQRLDIFDFITRLAMKAQQAQGLVLQKPSDTYHVIRTTKGMN